MKKELSWKKELELAEDYAKDGPYEWPKEYLNRCLQKAIDKAKKEGIDISKEIKYIKKIWSNQKK
ncbi:hypothetical protein HYT92_01190 [Candidatus Pacearchaeota archaeon]|nr:hypothetical protein [Candidatus Pacearchaeota archaeon]